MKIAFGNLIQCPLECEINLVTLGAPETRLGEIDPYGSSTLFFVGHIHIPALCLKMVVSRMTDGDSTDRNQYITITVSFTILTD